MDKTKIRLDPITPVIQEWTVYAKHFVLISGFLFLGLILIAVTWGAFNPEPLQSTVEADTVQTVDDTTQEQNDPALPAGEESQPVETEGEQRPDWAVLRPEVICHGEDPTQRYPIRQYRLQGKLQNWTCIPQYLVDDLENASLEYGIDVSMLAGLINTESAFDPNARSDAGAMGCAQFMAATWTDYYERLGLFQADWSVWDCEASVKMAAIKLHNDGWEAWPTGALYAYLGAGADWYVERVEFWSNLYDNEEV